MIKHRNGNNVSSNMGGILFPDINQKPASTKNYQHQNLRQMREMEINIQNRMVDARNMNKNDQWKMR